MESKPRLPRHSSDGAEQKDCEEADMEDVFGLWFIVGALLVFFMQAGFAMVEAGFTRAKNAGNIVM